MPHQFRLRVYYEDTDMAGIVYYANYLRFIERARSDWVRGLGIDQLKLKREEGIVFVVRRIEADYLGSAVLDDDLDIETTVEKLTPARLVMNQVVLCDTRRLFEARVVVAMVGPNGQPVRLPAPVRALMSSSDPS